MSAELMQASLFEFACYGAGVPANPRNPVAVTLKSQPAVFGFGVRVADVGHVVLELAAKR